MQLIAADAFKPIVAPSLATTLSTLRPTTIGFQQKTALTKLPPLNVYIDSKDAPVAEALRREPISRYRNRNRRPFKRYHSQNYNRPRRRPKPVYGPPGYTYDAPLPNDFRFDSDFFDGTPTFTSKPSKKKPPSVAYDPKDYSIVDTDIGKFYDSSSATFHVGPFKSTYDSSGSAFFGGASATAAGTASGSGIDDSGADFDEMNNYKYIGSSSALGGETEFKFTAPSAAADDSDRYKFGAPFSSSAAGSDASPDYKFTSFGSDAAAGPYPPSTSNFDASKFNLYAPQSQVVYPTAPKTLQSNRAKLPGGPYPAAAKMPTHYNENVLTKPVTASYSFGAINEANAFNQQSGANANTFDTTFKQRPPSTSYGVPIAPALNAFTYQSSFQSANGNDANSYLPSGQSNVQTQNNFVPISSISLTNSQETGSQLPEGHFAEPPPLNEQELANVDDQLYRKPQSSYDATPKMRRSSTTAKPPPTRRPNKVHSKRVTTPAPKIAPQNSREEFDYDVGAADDGDDDDASSYVVRSKPMPQPALPNSYDQEEFHTVTKGKRKPSRTPQKNFDDFASYFDQTEIGRKPKKPKVQRTPPTQQMDYVTESNFEIPDEDYVDDLVRTQTPQTPAKKRPLPSSPTRPKRPTKTTTPHILDTEDLRAAFAADLANQQFSFNSGKSRRNTNRNRYQQQQQLQQQEQQQQDDDFDDDDEEIVEIDSNERKTVVRKVPRKSTRQNQSTAHRIEQGTLQPPSAWNKNTFYYKQQGIQSRNDNFAYGNDPIFRHAFPFHPSSILTNGADPNSGERISSTLRTSIATTPTSALYVWDGKTMPKNHKMA